MRKHLFLRGPKLEAVGGKEEPRCLFSSCFGAGFGRGLLPPEEEQQKPEPSSKEIRGGEGGAADSTTAAITTTSSSSKERKGNWNWWLDMTRQEFQSSFAHPHPSWPQEAGEREEEEDHDYCLFADPSSSLGGVCLQVSGGGSGGEKGKINVPLLLCEVSSRDVGGDLTLAFFVTHRARSRWGKAEEARVGMLLRVEDEDGTCRTEEAPMWEEADIVGTQLRQREIDKIPLSQAVVVVSSFVFPLRCGRKLLAVALELGADTGLTLDVLRLSIYTV